VQIRLGAATSSVKRDRARCWWKLESVGVYRLNATNLAGKVPVLFVAPTRLGIVLLMFVDVASFKTEWPAWSKKKRPKCSRAISGALLVKSEIHVYGCNNVNRLSIKQGWPVNPLRHRLPCRFDQQRMTTH
jgi:hypothetical protein